MIILRTQTITIALAFAAALILGVAIIDACTISKGDYRSKIESIDAQFEEYGMPTRKLDWDKFEVRYGVLVAKQSGKRFLNWSTLMYVAAKSQAKLDYIAEHGVTAFERAKFRGEFSD